MDESTIRGLGYLLWTVYSMVVFVVIYVGIFGRREKNNLDSKRKLK